MSCSRESASGEAVFESTRDSPRLCDGITWNSEIDKKSSWLLDLGFLFPMSLSKDVSRLRQPGKDRLLPVGNVRHLGVSER